MSLVPAQKLDPLAVERLTENLEARRARQPEWRLVLSFSRCRSRERATVRTQLIEVARASVAISNL